MIYATYRRIPEYVIRTLGWLFFDEAVQARVEATSKMEPADWICWALVFQSRSPEAGAGNGQKPDARSRAMLVASMNPGRRGDVGIGAECGRETASRLSGSTAVTANASVRCQSCILAVGSQEHDRSSAAAQDLVRSFSRSRVSADKGQVC